MSRTSTAIAALAAALAGCGGGDADEPRRVAVPPAAAAELAGHSEAIANSLDAGDTCGAAAQLDLLRRTTAARVRDGSLPRPYRARIRRALVRLERDVVCIPAPVAPSGEGREDEEHEEDDDDEEEDDD